MVQNEILPHTKLSGVRSQSRGADSGEAGLIRKRKDVLCGQEIRDKAGRIDVELRVSFRVWYGTALDNITTP